MQAIIINNKSYYLCTDLFEHHKDDFSGCKGRDVIKKKKLKSEDYIYAYNTKSGWKVSTEDYAKAKVLICVLWYQQKYGSIELNNTHELSESNTINNLSSDNTSVLNHSISTINKYPNAPETLDIEEYEKFRDSNGQTLDITIRGERNHKNCYFRLKDISRCFEMPNIDKNIKDTKSSYEIEIDYKIFTRNSELDESKNETYLTYNGIMKVLYGSHSKNARFFQNWATETLFTVQLGTEDSKYELVKSMFGGASVNAIKEAFKTSSGKTPCVYLFAIGNANNLLNTKEYSEDTLLYKFGNTDDLPRRSGEHERDFKKIFKINHIELMLFSVIDPKYIFDAESSLKDYFKLNKVNFKNTNELIALNKMEYEKATKHYKLIKNSYIGCYMEMQDKIDKLERRLKDLQNEYDLTKEKLENKLIVKDKDIDIIKQQFTNEILTKDNELKIKDKNIELIEKSYELQTEKLQSELKLKDRDLEIINLKYKMLQEQYEKLSLKTQKEVKEL
jgi:hypothetical protein